MTLQYIIIGVILLLALLYAGRRLYLSIKHSGDKCYGCAGCELHDRILKQQGKEKKPECYH